MDLKRAGRFITTLRNREGVSRLALSKKTLISRGVIARIEQGEHDTSLTPWYIDHILRALGQEDLANRGLFHETETCHGCGRFVGAYTPLDDAASAAEWLARINTLDPNDPKMPFEAAIGKNLVEHARALQIGSRALVALIAVWFDGRVPYSDTRAWGSDYWLQDPLESLMSEAVEALDDAQRALRRFHVTRDRGRESFDAWLLQVAPRRVAPRSFIYHPEVEP